MVVNVDYEEPLHVMGFSWSLWPLIRSRMLCIHASPIFSLNSSTRKLQYTASRDAEEPRAKSDCFTMDSLYASKLVYAYCAKVHHFVHHIYADGSFVTPRRMSIRTSKCHEFTRFYCTLESTQRPWPPILLEVDGVLACVSFLRKQWKSKGHLRSARSLATFLLKLLQAEQRIEILYRFDWLCLCPLFDSTYHLSRSNSLFASSTSILVFQ